MKRKLATLLLVLTLFSLGVTMPTKLDLSLVSTIPTATERNVASLHAREDGIHAVSQAAQDSGLLTLIGRQGGHATNWDTQGTTNYPAIAGRVQMGVAAVTLLTSEVTNFVAVTFPVAFTGQPAILLSWGTTGTPPSSTTGNAHLPRTVTTTGFVLHVQRDTAPGSVTMYVIWVAIGPG